jgi:hypothetical protein
MTDTIDEALNRPGDEVAPVPKKPSRAKAAPVEPGPDLAAENAELKARLAAIEKVLSAMGSPVPEPTEPAIIDTLDTNRPYSKTRTMGGGVTFSQDGRTFNARGTLMS